MTRQVTRGEIYYADLSPVKGSEQGGVRPVLIIQNDIGNKYSPTTIIAPITSKGSLKKSVPTHIDLNKTCGLPEKSTVLLEQIRIIDKQRLRDRAGKASAHSIEKIDFAIKISLGLK